MKRARIANAKRALHNLQRRHLVSHFLQHKTTGIRFSRRDVNDHALTERRHDHAVGVKPGGHRQALLWV
ncbi:hypothetical protein EHJ11_06375 [Cronobacter turicensis]|nr:hypothetical protein [Cronobacter turicensis]